LLVVQVCGEYCYMLSCSVEESSLSSLVGGVYALKIV
jgi:hypothetical protein